MSSRPGYSWLGQLVTFGALPWFVAVAYLVPVPPSGISAYIVSMVMFAPAALWLAGKFAGPNGKFSWFYREPAVLTLDGDGIHWQSRFAGPFRRPEPVHIPWREFGGIELRALQLSVVDQHGTKVRIVPIDLERLCAPGAHDEYTLAQAIVEYRPRDFVTAAPARWGRPGGVVNRPPGVSASSIETRPISRLPQRILVVYVLFVFVVAVVTAQLRQ